MRAQATPSFGIMPVIKDQITALRHGIGMLVLRAFEATSVPE